ncbi:MAG: helix-turn-helix domain-containing protein [Cytobacillus gottheilii]|uniref:helix-turn-helix domain-containing protein n=1 Tax=Cytobacillus gottheilii TaxID=859144 RepID=UPI00346425B1
MYSYIERKIQLSILKTLYDYLEYDFESKVTESPDKEDEGYILLRAEEHFKVNKEDLLIAVRKESVRLVITDLFTIDPQELGFINELNGFYDYTKFYMNDEGKVYVENFFYVGQHIVDVSPYLLIINFKKFIEEVDDVMKRILISNGECEEDERTNLYTITIIEAAQMIGVSKTTVTNWVNSGYIQGDKIKGKWMLNKQSVNRFNKNWQNEKMQLENEFDDNLD